MQHPAGWVIRSQSFHKILLPEYVCVGLFCLKHRWKAPRWLQELVVASEQRQQFLQAMAGWWLGLIVWERTDAKKACMGLLGKDTGGKPLLWFVGCHYSDLHWPVSPGTPIQVASSCFVPEHQHEVGSFHHALPSLLSQWKCMVFQIGTWWTAPPWKNYLRPQQFTCYQQLQINSSNPFSTFDTHQGAQ